MTFRASDTGVSARRALMVVAHSVLHHVENLEHAYAQIERCMRPEATLVVSEYVRPNRFQYGDDVLSMINALLRALPEELRRPFEARTRPTGEGRVQLHGCRALHP